MRRPSWNIRRQQPFTEPLCKYILVSLCYFKLRCPEAHLSIRRGQLAGSAQGLLSQMDPVAQVVHPFLELQPSLNLSDFL